MYGKKQGIVSSIYRRKQRSYTSPLPKTLKIKTKQRLKFRLGAGLFFRRHFPLREQQRREEGKKKQ
jgi:hypothetical protein